MAFKMTSYAGGSDTGPTYSDPPQKLPPEIKPPGLPKSPTTPPGPTPGPQPPGAIGNFTADYLNQVPEAGFWAYLQGKGLLGQTPMDKYSQNRQGYYYSRFLADAVNNPNEGFYDYLMRNQFDPRNEFMDQSPSQRGDFSSQYQTPRSRWVPVG